MTVAADDKRLRRFVDLRTGGIARLSGLDRPDHFLDEVTMWCRGERRLGDPVRTDDLARIFLALSRAQKGGEQALASFAAAAVQLLVSQR